MHPESESPIIIAGAGLAGALLATLLAQRGWSVQVLERRPDPRQRGFEGGRSINLALAERGLHGLRLAGLEDVVMRQAVMMRGRMVHFVEGNTELQPYGRDEREVIWSVHRGRLNHALLDAAEAAGASLHFNRRVQSVDFANRSIEIVSDMERSAAAKRFTALIGADGAGSAVRAAMQQAELTNERWESLGHSYKELEIPPDTNGGFRTEPNALHIWPRGGHMCIALPNTEGTFTVTLFLPNEGYPSFAQLHTVNDARAFFQRDFADLLPLVPEFEQDFVGNPTSALATLYVDRWHAGGSTVLIGDAAHAMVPFHGQGMNCAFEDCVALAEHIDSAEDFASAFAAFEAERAPNALAIQQMALDNYIEMRDRVDDADYRLQRELELLLAKRHPERFVPRYSQVMFQRVPYAQAQAAGQRQRAILAELTRGCERIEQVDMAAADAAVARL